MQTKTNWSEGHKRTIIGRFNKYLFPWLGKKVIRNITPPEVSALLEKNIKKGNHETAHRLLSIINQVFDFAIASGKIEFNPIQSLKRTLPSTNTKHFAFIRDPKKLECCSMILITMMVLILQELHFKSWLMYS